MGEFIIGIVFTVFIVLLIFVSSFDLVPSSVKRECELNLPCNQQCVLVVIPESENQ